ncbi:DUF350 domain-containing protein [Actinokineospora iranica]|uniref:Uncharacterized membrane protein YjfL, UPF0719 family n=1 Tax=Actinokineospora iranica TaxID=1271860 RepID=A0A1G6YZY4_9PSEU|nr:DUF350 domain-containing protein [Actinokineospora iranica]SDD95195.1 Uncharacterized membrane protein YjfL, UPF0719 family [Actinokineospora iranica]
MSDLLNGLIGTLAYGAVGLVLMALGFVLVDVATPGKLRDLIWVEHNRNAAVLLCSGLFGIGVILTTAIVISDDNLAVGLVNTGIYGILGLALMSLSFVVIDAATPGKLGEVLATTERHPGVWVSATAHVVVSVIIAAAIS